MKFLAYLIIFFALVGIGTGAFFHLQLNASLEQEKFIDIPRGAGVNGVASVLETAGLMPVNRAVYKLLVLLTDSEGTLKAGQYRITPEINSYDLLAAMRAGKVAQHRITFVEGWTVKQIRESLINMPFMVEVTTGMNDAELAVELGIEGSMEGWLFPDTYLYVKDDSDLTVLKRAYDKMKATLSAEWAARAAFGTLSNEYEALILASMIEKETGYDPDRNKIATVFHNRLNRRMKLQSDPTVIFGLGDNFDGDLKRHHLTTTSGHNTYMRYGLPVTPICAPGLASIKAALAQPDGEFLYFVAKGNGQSYFSLTLKEHNKAVNKYQKITGGKLHLSEHAGGDSGS